MWMTEKELRIIIDALIFYADEAESYAVNADLKGENDKRIEYLEEAEITRNLARFFYDHLI